MIYLELFYEFFMTGLLAVGGGLATIPFLTKMSGNHPDWFSVSDLADMIAVSESTPGPIGVNMACFVGYKVGGILGAVITPVALALPSVIVIISIAKILDKYMDNPFVKKSFSALRAAVTGLIAAAGWVVIETTVFVSGKLNLTDWSAFTSNINIGALVLLVVLFAFTQIKPLKKLHPIVFIALGAVVGIAFKL